MDILSLVTIAILIALTAFFVSSEFAIVKVRSSRIEQLIDEGNSGAVQVKKVIDNLDEYLSACQLGITVTALGIGWLGEPAFASILDKLFASMNISSSISHAVSITISFLIITFLHVVVGELAPKTVAIQKAEKVALWTARPLILFYKIMYPFIFVLNGSARGLVGLFGIKPANEHEEAHSEDELRIILSESYESGEINQSELQYVNKIFDFTERVAKEIMVPRTEIVSFSYDDTLDNFMVVAHKEQFTRYPITDGDKDHIIGIVNMKEVMTHLLQNPEIRYTTLEQFVRPIIRVIDTMAINDLLLKMQKERIHMAVLMDEYGGTSGLVTVEDILEEIVGDIQDEFDMDEIPEVRQVAEGHYIIDAKMLVSDVNNLLDIDISDEEVDTIGGWFLTEDYEAEINDVLTFDNYEFKIIDMEDHHIKYLEVKKAEQLELKEEEQQKSQAVAQ